VIRRRRIVAFANILLLKKKKVYKKKKYWVALILKNCNKYGFFLSIAPKINLERYTIPQLFQNECNSDGSIIEHDRIKITKTGHGST